ncbi:hypothetical protein ACOYR1_01965 [Thalassotalea piscium]
MKQRLSFGHLTLLDCNVVEVVVDAGIKVTLEMVEECDKFIESHCLEDFGLLINRVNAYDFTYEAKLSIASYANLKAIAFVYYSSSTLEAINKLVKIRAHDVWNTNVFSGLNMGWQDAFHWLHQELSLTCEK